MSSPKRLTDYAVNKDNPYIKSNGYVSSAGTLSINIDEDDFKTKSVVEVHHVDKDELVETIAQILKKRLKISKSGLVLFRYIYQKYKYNKNNSDNKELHPVEIDYKVCTAEMGYTSYQSVYNSLLELLDKNVIARSDNEKVYYLNPLFFSKTKKLMITEYYKLTD